jgi:hypothetical protein
LAVFCLKSGDSTLGTQISGNQATFRGLCVFVRHCVYVCYFCPNINQEAVQCLP